LNKKKGEEKHLSKHMGRYLFKKKFNHLRLKKIIIQQASRAQRSHKGRKTERLKEPAVTEVGSYKT